VSAGAVPVALAEGVPLPGVHGSHPFAVPVAPLQLTSAEQAAVLGELMSPRFVDHAPLQVYATVLDEGRTLCSTRTLHRLLAAQQAVHERRKH
jgi:putative transposase